MRTRRSCSAQRFNAASAPSQHAPPPTREAPRRCVARLWQPAPRLQRRSHPLGRQQVRAVGDRQQHLQRGHPAAAVVQARQVQPQPAQPSRPRCQRQAVSDAAGGVHLPQPLALGAHLDGPLLGAQHQVRHVPVLVPLRAQPRAGQLLGGSLQQLSQARVGGAVRQEPARRGGGAVGGQRAGAGAGRGRSVGAGAPGCRCQQRLRS